MSGPSSPGKYAPKKRRVPTLRCATFWITALVLFCAWLLLLLFLFSTRFQGLFITRNHEEAHEEAPVAIEEEEKALPGFVTKRQLQDLALRYQREGIIILLVCNLGACSQAYDSALLLLNGPSSSFFGCFQCMALRRGLQTQSLL